MSPVQESEGIATIHVLASGTGKRHVCRGTMEIAQRTSDGSTGQQRVKRQDHVGWSQMVQQNDICEWYNNKSSTYGTIQNHVYEALPVFTAVASLSVTVGEAERTTVTVYAGSV